MNEYNLPSYVSEKRLEERIGYKGLDMMKSKYLDRDNDGKIIGTPAQRMYTISREVANIDKDYGATQEEIEELTKKFYTAISDGEFSPGGRILSNAGTEIKALFNCYVLPIPDDMEGIFETLKKASLVHKNGGGTGYNISHMRPRGTYVRKSKGVASGPISFLTVYDKETETINSGNRRGANMGIMNIYHPDIIEFIHAKTTEGMLTNFNVSVGATNEFMKAVENEGYYNLMFPKGEKLKRETLESMIKETEKSKAGAGVNAKPSPYSLRIEGDKIFDKYENEEIGRINKEGYVQLDASKVFNRIARLAHATGDPGVIFLDYINKDNLLKEKGDIEATNPCGEQPLHPYDACNLGSINLSEMVSYKNGKAEVNYDKIKETTRLGIRFLDNCNDLNEGPIKEIEKTVKRHRRVGLGVMGFADMLAKLEVPYGSEESFKLAEKVMGTITDEAKSYSEKLAEEKGPFPDFDISEYKKKGEKPIRNLQRTTIAPTGSISMLFQCSSGIEPYFGVIYTKNLRGGDKVKTLLPEFVKSMEKRGKKITPDLELKISENNGSVQDLDCIPEDIQKSFKTSQDITYEQHIKMQAAFQKRLDNAVSKTINMKNNATIEDVKKAYMMAWKEGCKGITIYRDKSKDVQVIETKAVVTPNLHRRYIETGCAAIEKSPYTEHYKIKRGNERMHVLITSRLFKKKDTNEYYFLPHAIFQVTKPVGTERAGEFAQSGIDRTQVLQSPNPDYVTLIRDLKSVKGDRSEGIGPNRIDSPSHGVGLCLEDMLLSQEVVGYDEWTKELKQLVKKSELEEVDLKKSRDIQYVWGMSEKEKNEKGKLYVRGNRELGIQFVCEQCGSKEYTFKNGCIDPVCKECEWSTGKCD